MAAHTQARVVRVGESPDADVRAEDVEVTASGTRFTVTADGVTLPVRLRVLGEHHVGNALAAIAAAVWAWPEGSITNSTGHPVISAMSAVAPVPETPRAATPSNNPIEPSASTRSASAPRLARWTIASDAIAQLSRLTDGRPVATAWNAGSM